MFVLQVQSILPAKLSAFFKRFHFKSQKCAKKYVADFIFMLDATKENIRKSTNKKEQDV